MDLYNPFNRFRPRRFSYHIFPTRDGNGSKEGLPPTLLEAGLISSELGTSFWGRTQVGFWLH